MTVHAHAGSDRLLRVRLVVYALGLALALVLGYASTRGGSRGAASSPPSAVSADREPANPAENR